MSRYSLSAWGSDQAPSRMQLMPIFVIRLEEILIVGRTVHSLIYCVIEPSIHLQVKDDHRYFTAIHYPGLALLTVYHSTKDDSNNLQNHCSAPAL